MAVIGASVNSIEDISNEMSAPVLYFGQNGLDEIPDTLIQHGLDRIWESKILRTVWNGWLYKYKVKARQLYRGGVYLPDDLLVESPYGGNEYLPLDQFLTELGFPAAPRQGDDLYTMEVSKLAVLDDKDRVHFVDEDFFVHRSLVDEDGNLIYIGLDEGIEHARDDGAIANQNIDNFRWAPFPIRIWPWMGYGLKKYFEKSVRFRRYLNLTPLFRFTCFPQTTEIYLPLLDYPKNLEGAPEIFIRPDGKGTIFLPHEGISLGEMAERLWDLWKTEYYKVNGSLLSITRNADHVNSYLEKKQAVIAEYFETVSINLSL
jgi:hypothetical protein